MDKKGTESVAEHKTVEETVDTVDYRSAAGKGRDEAKEEPVKIVHSTTEGDTDPTIGGKIGGALTGAAAAVSNTVQSAKEAISGGDDHPKKDTAVGSDDKKDTTVGADDKKETGK